MESLHMLSPWTDYIGLEAGRWGVHEERVQVLCLVLSDPLPRKLELKRSSESHLRSPAHLDSRPALSTILCCCSPPPGLRRGKCRNLTPSILGLDLSKRSTCDMRWWGEGRKEEECHLIHNQITEVLICPGIWSKTVKNKNVSCGWCSLGGNG